MEDAYVKEILSEVRQGLTELYGARLQKLVLYGSFARGDATSGSDLDLIVVLDHFVSVGKEISTMSELLSALSLKNGITISALPVQASEYEHQNSPLLRNVRSEGMIVD